MRFFKSLPICAFILFLVGPAFGAPFVTGPVKGSATKSLKWKISKPKLKKDQVLDLIELRGCWLNEGLKSLKVTNKKGKAVKSARNKKTGTFELKTIKSTDWPLTVTSTLTSSRPVVKGNSSVIAYSSASCTKKKKNPCAVAQPLASKVKLDGVFCNLPSDFGSIGSDGLVVLGDGDETTFFPTSAKLRFALHGATFLPDLKDATVFVGDTAFVAPDLALEGGLLVIEKPSLKDGLQTVSVHALDSKGEQLSGTFNIWAGSSTLTVLAVNSSNQPAGKGTVKIELGDDQKITQTMQMAAGQAAFINVPERTVAIEVETAIGETGFLATTGNAGTVTIPVKGISAPSTLSNNDFTQGTAGWDFGAAPVETVPHVENIGGTASAQEDPDLDLQLSTSGQGLQTMSRTFKTKPGTKAIVVRYRFVTSEFPGGYFGTKYNDYFNLAIRTLVGHGNLTDGTSMNSLGKGAFSLSGSTAWRTVRLPVEKAGDTIQVDVAVANVADGAYGSQVIIDSIKESQFAITKAGLNDIDGSSLAHLSADEHPYFDKFTHIWGTVRVEGPEKEGLKDLELQILEAAQVVRTAKLSTQAAEKIIKKFGKTGFVEIVNPMLLFKLFPKDGAAMDTTLNRTFTLRMRATSEKGEIAEADVGTVDQLVRFKGTQRYGQRDDLLGGDDWATPSSRRAAIDLVAQGATIGDISNMNGGFFPEHSEHREGSDIDAWVEGYNARNSSTASSMIHLLNSPVGSRIARMLVAFTRDDHDPFYAAIKGKSLQDGRRADQVIVPDSQHDTHFHVDIRQ